MAPTPSELQARNEGAPIKINALARASTAATASPKPAPEPISSPVLTYGERVRRLMISLGNVRAPINERIDAAMALGEYIPLMAKTYLFDKSRSLMCKVMLDDLGEPALRSACALAIGSSGVPALVGEMKGILKGQPPEGKPPKISQYSKFLALKVLSVLRTAGALELLGEVAVYGDDDGLAFAAAKELTMIGSERAREAVGSALRGRKDFYTWHPELAAELRRMMPGESQAN